MLGVNALNIVWAVILPVHRQVAQMPVGVEPRAGTDYRVYGVAQGVVHRKVYNKVENAAVGVAQTLGVKSRQTVAHPVGVETGARTYHRMYGVANGVRNKKMVIGNAVAGVVRNKMHLIYTSSVELQPSVTARHTGAGGVVHMNVECVFPNQSQPYHAVAAVHRGEIVIVYTILELVRVVQSYIRNTVQAMAQIACYQCIVPFVRNNPPRFQLPAPTGLRTGKALGINIGVVVGSGGSFAESTSVAGDGVGSPVAQVHNGVPPDGVGYNDVGYKTVVGVTHAKHSVAGVDSAIYLSRHAGAKPYGVHAMPLCSNRQKRKQSQ